MMSFHLFHLLSSEKLSAQRLEAGPFLELQRFRWHDQEAPTIQVPEHTTKALQGLQRMNLAGMNLGERI